MQTCDLIIQDDQAHTYWKNRALVLKGKCFERLNKQNRALDLYYNVITSPREDEEIRSDLWYFQAGKLAIEILRKKENWAGAIAIADRLGRSSGARAKEFKETAESLRLDHFFDDDLAPDARKK